MYGDQGGCGGVWGGRGWEEPVLGGTGTGRSDFANEGVQGELVIDYICDLVFHTHVQATLQLADSLNIDLTVAFSESTQPLTMVYTSGEEDDFDIFCAIATTTCDAFPVDLGKAGVNAPPPNGLDSKPRRMISDLTEDGYPKRDGAEEAEGSAKRRRASGTPRRSGTAQLGFTPNARAASAQPQIALNSVPPSRVGSSADQGGDPGGGEETALFLPGGSQEDQHDEAPPARSQAATQRQVLTQQELLKLSGLAESEQELEALADYMEDGEDEEFSATQQNPQANPGVVAGADEWNDAEIENNQSGFPPASVSNEFDAHGSIFDTFDFPAERSQPNPRNTGGAVMETAGNDHRTSPVRPPRTPGRSSGQHQSSPERSAYRTTPAVQPQSTSAPALDRSQPKTPGRMHRSHTADLPGCQQDDARSGPQAPEDPGELMDDDRMGPTPGSKILGKVSHDFSCHHYGISADRA